jgi:uncharacterized protein YfbU (UPF0304 family)
MKLSRTERWMLANQYRILAALYPEQAAVYRGQAEALERGYQNAIDRMSAHVMRDDTNRKESDEVDEILTMFDAVQRAYRTLDDNFGIDAWRVSFTGFDRTTEEDYLGYAHYLLSHERRYPNMATGADLDAGRPMLRDYRRMVDEWKKRGSSTQLDRKDLIAILDARRED